MSKVSLTTIAARKHVLRWREGGRHRQATVNDSLRVAERQRAVIEDRLRSGIADASRLTVADIGEMYLANRKPQVTDKTMLGYSDQWERLVEPYLGAHRLDLLRPHHVEDWLAEMQRDGVGREMQRKSLTRLRSALKFAMRREMIATNAAVVVDMPPPPPKQPIHITTVIEVERMRADAIAAGHDTAALQFLVLFCLGLRPSEMFGLTAGALKPEGLLIDQRRTLKIEVEGEAIRRGGQIEEGTKTNVIRMVDLPDLVRDDLAAYIDERDLDDEDLLFPNADGGPLTDNQYRSWRRNRFDRYRLDTRATPYSARHSAASMLLHAHGAGRLAYIARQLGHSPTECLKTYQHVIDDLPEDLELIPVNKIISRARRQVRRERAKLRVA